MLRSRAAPTSRPLSAGYGAGQRCAIARQPSALCSPPSPPAPHQLRSPTADTDRAFADGGHSLDFTNKAFECLDLIGWEHANAALPTVVGQMVAARGAEESTAWRQPIDLIALCTEAAAELPDLFAARPNMHGWSDHAALARALLGDHPVAIMDALKAAIRAGAIASDLGRSLAYAAALRLARFGTANEHADWETAHHVFTYANAIKRIGTADRDGHIEAVHGVLHGAMALYLARYLNVPPARIPGEGSEPLDDLPANAEEIRVALLDVFDRQRQVDLAARLVARHLTLGHSVQSLIAILARALLREDAGFHAYQVLDAGVRQFGEWGNTDEGRHILIAVVRFSLRIRLRNAPNCKRPTSHSGSCVAVSFIRIPQPERWTASLT